GSLRNKLHDADTDSSRDRPAQSVDPRDSTISDMFGCWNLRELVPQHRQRSSRHECCDRARSEAHGFPTQRLAVGHAWRIPVYRIERTRAAARSDMAMQENAPTAPRPTDLREREIAQLTDLAVCRHG